MTDQPKVNLVQRLAKATAEVGGKLKADKRNAEQNYSYVSADKILSACGQALADNGIVVIPSIVKQEITLVEYTNSYNKALRRYDATIDLVLKVTDGETEFDEPWFGMGSDYQTPDKALYKAITSGHKYFMSKLFCIGEGNEDSEHDEPEGQPAKQPANGKPAPVPTLKPLQKPTPVTAEAIVAEVTGEPEPPAVPYSPCMGKKGANIGKHEYPTAWARIFAAYTRCNAYEVDGILQQHKPAGDMSPEAVVEIVNQHLAAKAQAQ